MYEYPINNKLFNAPLEGWDDMNAFLRAQRDALKKAQR